MDDDFLGGIVTCRVHEQSRLACGHCGVGENHLDDPDSLVLYPKPIMQAPPLRCEALR